ncbi:proline racemase family protein [Baekduia sp. Peel2402]|uniref:proline racemase family protein n=1 Tax=Baekduia sp. Peel2402 TaxID=3458296 RepID=UPI00403E7BAF
MGWTRYWRWWKEPARDAARGADDRLPHGRRAVPHRVGRRAGDPRRFGWRAARVRAGEVDRSPCGSATSARTVLLHADGHTAPWTNHSISGGAFTARALDATPADLLTEVSGMAYRTGEHTFTLDPRDPLGTGFVLR